MMIFLILLEIALIYFVYINLLILRWYQKKLYDEVSTFLTEEEFENVYNHATNEPNNCLYIDTHPNTGKDKTLRRKFEIVLSIV